MNRIFEVGKVIFFILKFKTFEFLKSKIQNVKDSRSNFQFLTSRTSISGLTFVRKEPAGFTLVEVLVAISILVIIGAVSVPNLMHFNESQILQNTTSDLVRVLRQAQSSANSHTQCTSVLIAKDWEVDISASSYTLKAKCYDPKTSAEKTDTIYTPTANSINGVGLSIRSFSSATNLNTNCGTSETIKFLAEYLPYNQNSFSNISNSCGIVTDDKNDKLEIKLSKTGLTDQYVCINKGGAIYASANKCFS